MKKLDARKTARMLGDINAESVGTAAPAASITRSAPAAEGEEAKAVTVTAEQRAQEAVTIVTVADQRQKIESSQSELHAKTTQEVSTLFEYAQNLKPLPANSELIPTGDPNIVKLATRDENGILQEITTATKHADGTVELDTVRAEDERQERDVVRLGPDGSSTVQHADWANTGTDLSQAPTIESLKQTWDPNVLVTENQVRREGDQLKTTEYVQAGGGAEQSETVFSKQNLNDIDDVLNEELADSFKASIESDPNKDPMLDVATKSTYVIPPPGTADAEGEPVPPLFTQTTSYSRPGMQATSVATTPMDTDDLDVDDDLEHGPHGAEDLSKVISAFREEDGEEDIQDKLRTWTLEKSSPNSYSSQTFQEGNEDAGIVMHRTVEGASVTETYSGKTAHPDPKEDDLVDVNGTTTRTYAEDGSLQSMTSTTLNADGSTTKNEYQCDRVPTDKGLEVTERMTSIRTDPEGQSHTSQQTTKTLISDQGTQLLSTSATTTGPDGTQAHSVVDETGQKLSVTQNGQELPITDPAQLPPDLNVQELALQANIATAKTIKDYAINGGAKALDLMKLAGSVDLSPGGQPVAFEKLFATGYKLFGNDAVQRALQGGAGVLGAAGGAAGVVAGGLQVFDAVRNENIPQIIQGLVNVGLGASSIYQGGQGFYNAIRGIAKPVPISTGALIPKWFQKVPGLSALSKSTGVLRVLKAVKALGGITTVLGVALGAVDMIDGLRKGNWAQVAKGGVGVASTIGGAVASGAVAGAVGGPLGALAGIMVVGGFALGGWLVNKFIDWAFGPDRDMAAVAI
jgi:hypothetical protein